MNENPASVLLEDPEVKQAVVDYRRQLDIEKAIMTSPMDYLTASEIFAALQRRLELRYDNLNPQVEEAMQKLSKAFDLAS